MPSLIVFVSAQLYLFKFATYLKTKSDPFKFIEKCTEYYKAFGITFSLTKDKKINNKFYIKLVVEKELIFTALAS